MRYRLLGDILGIKSALFYRRGYVDSIFKRNPVGQMNSVRVNQSRDTSFMEYNFKFKIDKGYYASYDIYDYLSDATLNSLSNKDDEFSVPSNLLMYQLSNSTPDRDYTFFEIYNTSDITEVIVNVDPDIQKIEFFGDILDYKFNDDGLITEVEEYDENDPDPLAAVPIMIIEFGPETSYEPEDYYNQDEMPDKPNWDEESEWAYQYELEEYTNKKFLFISTTPSESTENLNLSLYAHKAQTDPHRFQERYVIENKDMKHIMNDVGNTIEKDENTNVIFDSRSRTILGSESVDDSSLILLNDKINKAKRKVAVTIKDEEGNETTEYYDEYRDYLVYNKGDMVYYKGDVFVSMINGNLYENPYISPMWQLKSYIDENTPPPVEETPHVVNIRVNDPFLGTTEPIGPTTVEYGHELFVKIITERAYVDSIQLDGVNQTLPLGDIFTVPRVVDDHDLLINFTPIYKTLTIIVEPEGSGVVTGDGTYIVNTSIDLTATPNYGYHFLGWYYNDELLSSELNYTLPKLSDNMIIIARFEINKYNVVVECTEGGVFSPYSGNPTTIVAEHGSSLTIQLIPDTGYVVDFVVINSELYDHYEGETIELTNIVNDYNIYISFSRPQFTETDPVLGRIEYVVIGDQLWDTSDIDYHIDGSFGVTNEFGSVYYDGEEMQLIGDLLTQGGTGFRVPSKEDWDELYAYFDVMEAAHKLKSPDLIRFNSYGWKDSVFRGLGRYRFNALPFGSYFKPSDELDGQLTGLNTESWHWSSTIDEKTDSAFASALYHDSPIGFITKDKLSDRHLNVRVVKDCPKVEIFGTSYRYLTFSVDVEVRLIDDDNVSSNDRYETHRITQSWMIDNLDYTELGTRFEESECGKFGSLYTLDEVLQIDQKLDQEDTSGFRVPSNLDYIFLEKYLGYGRDQVNKNQQGILGVDSDSFITGYIGSTEGKRLRTGDLVYSGIDWNGYGTDSLENSQLNVLPSGYAEVADDGSIQFLGMGSDAKYWTSTILDPEASTLLAYSRSINYLNDRILRGTDQGNRVYMSVRLVRTTDEII